MDKVEQIKKASIKKIILSLENHIDSLRYISCTFWACRNRPFNNRIENMVTCSKCQAIILSNREIKKLKTLI